MCERLRETERENKVMKIGKKEFLVKIKCVAGGDKKFPVFQIKAVVEV